MDAFESLMAMLLKRDGYWTTTGFKIELTKSEKRRMGRATTPRWELDIVAYRGSTNEVLAIECKSFIDSLGVVFRNGKFEPENRYKLFTDSKTRRIVLSRLMKQLTEIKACRPNPTITLCLAAGKIAGRSNRDEFERHFAKNKWRLFDEQWTCKRLKKAADAGYENDVAHVVAKLICRNPEFWNVSNDRDH